MLSGALTGALLAVSTCQIGLGLLAFVALVPLLLAIDGGGTPRRIVFGAWLGGVLFFSVALAWVPLVGIRGVLLGLAVGYVGVLGLSFAGFAAILTALRRRDRRLFLAAVPLVWISSEWIRSQGALGYPWHHVGYALANVPELIQLAAFGGVYALSLWIAGVNALVVGASGARRPTLVVAVAVLAAPLLLGVRAASVPTPGRTLRVAAVQPAVAQPGRSDPALFRANLHRLLDLSDNAARSRPDLLIWPESAFERPIRPVGDPFLSAVARHYEIPLLTGAWRLGPGSPETLYNSAMLVSREGEILPAGDKVHPVPFYEGRPNSPVERFMASFGLWPGRFQPGERSGLFRIHDTGGDPVTVGVLICLDSSYAELARDLRRRGAELLVEISNESQTGPWSAVQHALVSRLRAVESGLPLVRVGNAGPTEWIDARGRLVARIGPAAVAAESATVVLGEGPPPYLRLGDAAPFAIAWIASFSVPLATVAGRLRRRTSRSPHAKEIHDAGLAS